ncbi:MAG: hypothetical protein LBI67_08080 [Treponema sp.]|jgi:hypothetical protein|nr:hypothetical protein [Treponema sp.]
MMSNDYIPGNDAAFNWFKFLNQYVAAKCAGQSPEWTHIPEAARTELQGACALNLTGRNNDEPRGRATRYRCLRTNFLDSPFSVVEFFLQTS